MDHRVVGSRARSLTELAKGLFRRAVFYVTNAEILDFLGIASFNVKSSKSIFSTSFIMGMWFYY